MFTETIIRKISETDSSFYITQQTTGMVTFLFFKSLLLLLTKLSFWQEDLARGYHSMESRNFPEFCDFLKDTKS